MREKTYERRIRSYIAERGGWSVKYFANAYTPRGVPDILACVGGRFLAIEVKAEDGRATELQVRTVNEILRSGGLAVIARPSDWDALREMIDSCAGADGEEEI